MSSHIILKGSYREHPPEADNSGNPSGDQVVQVTMILRRRHDAPATHLSSTELSHDEFTDKHGANPADVCAVEQFATQYNLSVENVNPAARSITLTGPLSAFVTAFKADLALHTIDGHTVRTRQGHLFLPHSISDCVVGVFGLDERPVAATYH